jgi:hypothetical protein
MEKEPTKVVLRPNLQQSDTVLQICRGKLPGFDLLSLEEKQNLIQKYWERGRREAFEEFNRVVLIAGVLFNEGVRGTKLEEDENIVSCIDLYEKDLADKGLKDIDEEVFPQKLQEVFEENFPLLHTQDYVEISKDLKKFFDGLGDI